MRPTAHTLAAPALLIVPVVAPKPAQALAPAPAGAVIVVDDAPSLLPPADAPSLVPPAAARAGRLCDALERLAGRDIAASLPVEEVRQPAAMPSPT